MLNHAKEVITRVSFWIFVCLLSIFVVFQDGGGVRALDSSRAITQYSIDSWTVKDRLPSGEIYSIVQTPDGYIWISNNSGLVKFDGVNFSTPSDLQRALQTETVRAQSLLVTRDGSLWVGGEGFLCRLKDGEWSVYKEGIAVNCLTEGEDGSIWIGLGWAGLRRFKDGIFTQYPAVATIVKSIVVDRHGKIWLGTNDNGVLLLSGDSVTRYTTADGLASLHVNSIMEDDRGTIWAVTREGVERFINGRFEEIPESRRLPDRDVTCIREDRDGNLWMGTLTGGLCRVTHGRVESLNKVDGLTDNYVTCLTEDREGSLWIGTSDGLTRLKDGKLVSYTTREGLTNNRTGSIAEGQDGSIWVFSDGGGISRIKDGDITQITEREGLASNYGSPIYVSRDGSVWAGTANGLCRIKGGQITSFNRGILAHQFVSAILEDREGLIIAIPEHGLFRFDGSEPRPYDVENGEQLKNFYIYQGVLASNGTLWLATGTGLVSITGRQMRIYTGYDGLLDNNVVSITEDRNGTMWFATGKMGIVRMKDGLMVNLTMKDGLYDDRVSRVLDDAEGNLWMSSRRGIFRISRQDVEDFFEGRTSRMNSVPFGTSDGMKSSVCIWGTQGASCRTRSGVLWFVTTKGVVSIDPANLKMNTLAPPVVIEQVVVDDRVLPQHDDLEFQPGSQRIEFHFTGLSLLIPDKVQFRYMLEGFDQNWIDAGNRRVAYYTKIPPGTYRFRVIACNNDGVWNEEGASIGLSQKPFFYQTRYFYGLIILAVGLVIMIAYRIRVVELKARYQAVLQERNRIAREMHDTLAQNLGGVALQLDSMKMQFKDIPPGLLQRLDQACWMIRYSLAEAYRAVRNLRSQVLEARHLAEALPEIASQITIETGVEINAEVRGTPVKLNPEIEDNLLRILQEAISNAVKHADARNLDVLMQFEPGSVTLRVLDDGCGFDAGRTFSLGSGHYGLLGMRERAERIGARFNLESSPGNGTEILVQVPTN